MSNPQQLKSCPGNGDLAPGKVLRLPTVPGPGGAATDAVRVARLQPAPSVRWGVNSRPNGADLRGGGLLLSTGTHWLRYQGTPGLHGDPLVQDLAARPPVEWGWWQRRGEACGNEAIGWLPASGSPSFLAVSEAGLIRWWPG